VQTGIGLAANDKTTKADPNAAFPFIFQEGMHRHPHDVNTWQTGKYEVLY
jgi:hypothetical protein